MCPKSPKASLGRSSISFAVHPDGPAAPFSFSRQARKSVDFGRPVLGARWGAAFGGC